MVSFRSLKSSIGPILVLVLAFLTAASQAGPPVEEPSPPRIHYKEFEAYPFLDGSRPPVAIRSELVATDVTDWSKLVFQSYRDGNWEIYLANGDGSNQTRLTSDGASDIQARLNRGCTRIAFASKRAGNYEIYTMNVDGSGLTRLTSNGTDDVYPFWSPDGTKIVFQAYRDGQAEIYVMNADGSGQTRLTWNGEYDGEPSWSPDGTKIAFTSRRTGGYRIWVMNPDGGGKAQLSTQPYSENPVWSPDGEQIAYDSDGNADAWQELWLMNADGSDQRQVHNPSGAYSAHAWARSWSPDGRYVGFTRIYMIHYQDNWYWTRAYLDAWDSENGWATTLSDHDVDWHPGWQTADAWAPTSSVYALPAYSRNGLLVGWSGSDSGDAGIRSYDVQYRGGAIGSWTDWQVKTPEALASFSGAAGRTYYFRSRARDNAHNVEPWPSGERDTFTTLYTWSVDGTVRDNGGTPVVGGIINTTPGSFEANPTDSQGDYAAYVGESAITYTVTWEKSGYGDLPVTSYGPSQDAHVDVVLPPADNVVLNWGFESGGFGPGDWLAGGLITPVVTDSFKHTGNYAALLGQQLAFASPWTTASIIGNPAQLKMDESGGAIHLVWLEGEPEDLYYARRESDGSWSSPQNISITSGESLDAQLVADGRGMVHVVWSDDTPGYSDIYYARRGSDGTWSTPHNVSGDAERWHVTPQLAVDGNGAVHVVWTDSKDTYYARRESDGTWSSPQNVSNRYENIECFDPQVAVDGSGVVHVVWFDDTPGNHDIYYAWRESDGTWSSPQNLSNSHGESSSPQLMVDGSGAVHVVWSDRNLSLSYVFYARRGSDGMWSSPQNLSSNLDGSSPPQLVVDRSGVVHVVWVDNSSDDRGIAYARRESDGNWSVPLDVSNGYGSSSPPQLALDRSGAVHVVWSDATLTPDPGEVDVLDIYYVRRRSDGTWSSPQNISSAPPDTAGDSENPQLAVDGNGAVHVVWFESWRIYYVGPAFAEQTGDSSISQVLNVPATMANPTLSFLYQLGRSAGTGDSRLEAQLDTGTASTPLFTTATTSDLWRHHWSDLSPWVGQTITLTFNVHQAAGQPCTWAHLDEVTLGSTYPDLWVGAHSVAALPGEQAVYNITYGNQGGAAASDVLITATLPAELFFLDATPAPVFNTLLQAWEWDLGNRSAKSGPFTIILTTTVAPTATVFSTLSSMVNVGAVSPELETANNVAAATVFVGRRIHLPLIVRGY